MKFIGGQFKQSQKFRNMCSNYVSSASRIINLDVLEKKILNVRDTPNCHSKFPLLIIIVIKNQFILHCKSIDSQQVVI